MQELIDAELTAAIGAAPHERTEARSNQRNGSRSRLMSTPAGELRIPNLRVDRSSPRCSSPAGGSIGPCGGQLQQPTAGQTSLANVSHPLVTVAADH